MPTRKLYYEDCHLTECTAHVESCTPTEGGWHIILDQTVFYPEGGGQPCDRGTLNGVPVLDVQEQGEDVVHLCADPFDVGTEVTGKIDWERRFDLMQQHSGEHIVSGFIHARYGCHNVGFHMGTDVITIDFDTVIPAEELPEIEAKANAAIWKNTPLHIWYPTEEELPQVPYRSKKALPWPVRVVEFPEVDICACCGVHVAYTGEIGLVKLLSCVKFHQGVRIEMACGGRAVALLSAVFEENRQVSHAFSAKMLETGAAAKRMSDALAAEKYRVTGLQRQLFDYIAESCRDGGNILRIEDGLDPVGLRELTDKIADVCGGMAALFSGKDGEGYNFCLASREGDLREFGKEMTGTLSGRGGGKPGFIQGSVKADRAAIEAYFKDKM
ncbi:MAG: alanyl-tRNA editing protein [Ruminococcaceae bacterium]|nr:alanyl-tRNA editing protein [Oscillospiraceae bacterium]